MERRFGVTLEKEGSEASATLFVVVASNRTCGQGEGPREVTLFDFSTRFCRRCAYNSSDDQN